MNYCFTSFAWEDYLYWQKQDKKTLNKINALLKDIAGNPYSGIGKPEPLKDNLSGMYSRKINAKDRIIYIIVHDNIFIISLKNHYKD